jgi:hypothetical protein
MEAKFSRRGIFCIFSRDINLIAYTHKYVEITYDPAKNERNIRERKLSFDRANDFKTAVYIRGVHKDEIRWIAVGYLDNQLHMLVYIPTPNGIRVISFRKTNKREAKLYGKAQTIN